MTAADGRAAHSGEMGLTVSPGCDIVNKERGTVRLSASGNGFVITVSVSFLFAVIFTP